MARFETAWIRQEVCTPAARAESTPRPGRAGPGLRIGSWTGMETAQGRAAAAVPAGKGPPPALAMQLVTQRSIADRVTGFRVEG